jgi:hypothetical protein
MTGHPADVRTFPAQADTPFHKLHVALAFHPDHVVAALLADLRATKAGGETVFPFLCQRSLILVHGVLPSRVVIDHKRYGRVMASASIAGISGKKKRGQRLHCR